MEENAGTTRAVVSSRSFRYADSVSCALGEGTKSASIRNTCDVSTVSSTKLRSVFAG